MLPIRAHLSLSSQIPFLQQNIWMTTAESSHAQHTRHTHSSAVRLSPSLPSACSAFHRKKQNKTAQFDITRPKLPDCTGKWQFPHTKGSITARWPRVIVSLNPRLRHPRKQGFTVNISRCVCITAPHRFVCSKAPHAAKKSHSVQLFACSVAVTAQICYILMKEEKKSNRRVNLFWHDDLKIKKLPCLLCVLNATESKRKVN